MEAIAVIDFGSQYAHLIANRIRRLKAYAEILLPETPLKEFSKFKGIILSGGPQSVYEKGAPTIDKKIFSLGIPILGLCYGHQLIARLLGGEVAAGQTKEYGLANLTVIRKTGIFEGLKGNSQVWMSHGDTVTKLAPGFVHLGKTDDCKFTAAGNFKKNIFSTQFHVEVAHTAEGMKILENFLGICKIKREWSMKNFLEQKMEMLKRQLNGRKIFLLVSGGVDSTVAYALLSKALGEDRVYGLFIDTGLLRKNETEKTKSALKKIGAKNFHILNAKKHFLKVLSGVVSPEEKRKKIGDAFLDVQAAAVKKLKLNAADWVLGQGTIYPDTIESAGTKYADKIKTHHNRVPQILELIKKGKIIEPLAELYKDEVRELGTRLGLPQEVVWKHPFPGPGLAVRILCAEKNAGKTGVGEENEIAEYLGKNGLKGKILPIQSVGVQGDARTYRNPLAIWGRELDFSFLENISTALTNRFFDINRVCLLLSPEKIKNVRIIPGTLSPARIKLAAELDDIVMSFIKKNRIKREIWQFPTVLLPISVNGVKKESVMLRPVCSDEAMTANFYKMKGALLVELIKKLKPKVSAVFYDITNKPPGTIEWE